MQNTEENPNDKIKEIINRFNAATEEEVEQEEQPLETQPPEPQQPELPPPPFKKSSTAATLPGHHSVHRLKRSSSTSDALPISFKLHSHLPKYRRHSFEPPSKPKKRPVERYSTKGTPKDSPRTDDEMEERPVLLTRPRVLSSSLPVRPASASQLERQGTFRSTISDEPPSPAPSSRSLSIQEFQDTVKRLEKWEKSKLDKRQTLKKELANEEVKEVRRVPEIDAHSKKLIKNQEELIERMFIKWSETKKKIQAHKEQQDLAIIKTTKKSPEINQKSKELVRSNKIREEWQEMKVKKLKEERQKKVENEEKALQKLFKPQIDARSTKMAERKGITRKDVTERMLQDLNEREKKAQVAKKREVETFFHPKINARSKTIKQDTPVYDRLYNDGVRIMLARQKLVSDHFESNYDMDQTPSSFRGPIGSVSKMYKKDLESQEMNATFQDDFDEHFGHSHSHHSHFDELQEAVEPNITPQRTNNSVSTPTSSTPVGTRTPERPTSGSFDVRKVLLETYYGYTQEGSSPTNGNGNATKETRPRSRSVTNP